MNACADQSRWMVVCQKVASRKGVTATRNKPQTMNIWIARVWVMTTPMPFTPALMSNRYGEYIRTASAMTAKPTGKSANANDWRMSLPSRYALSARTAMSRAAKVGMSQRLLKASPPRTTAAVSTMA